MSAYLIRRLLLAIPTLLGVNILLFALFFVVNSPDDMARVHLGSKRVTPEAIERWKADRGYDKPLFFNAQASGSAAITDTIFFNKSVRMFALDFGTSDDSRNINYEIRTRAGPSLALAIPSFIIGLLAAISVSLFLVFVRASRLDVIGTVLCVVAMSISGMFYIIGGQFFFAKVLAWVPISGYQPGLEAWRFVIVPVIIGILGSLGGAARWYRSLFLEEINRDYVRTARAKGLSEMRVLFVHVLKNGMIPILTGVVVVIPSLFLGSLVSESFFGIPGLGSYTIDAIQAQDFAIVRAMVFIGAALYVLGLILTDISYTLVDPRVKLK